MPVSTKNPMNPSQLSVAFVWHMHQPYYKNALTGEYLMPWVRLHAIKDYLDMVVMLKEFPKIRITVNLVPSLIEQLEDYTREDTHDPQSRITVKPEFSPEDKHYLLERGFDAPYHTKIMMSGRYAELYHRLQHCKQNSSNWQTWAQSFSDQDFADIAVLFNLVWTDPHWLESIDELAALWNKQANYTLAERQRVIQIQRDIIKNIIPAYKVLQNDEQRIEVTTTPYYHPILPLLIDTQSARESMPNARLPQERYQHPEDAEWQLKAAVDCYTRCFDRPPSGLWPSEQSISPAVSELAQDHGFSWMISDEGNLARSLGFSHLSRDSHGNLAHPEVLCQPYEYNGVRMVFRHLALSDLIGFHYMNMPAQQAADDLYWRIKDIHNKCRNAGVDYPILTIALDGENCWETYPNDGIPFLKALYTRLSSDSNLNICRVSDYLAERPPQIPMQALPQLHSGSWINSDFHIWIGDPVKNAAWDLLSKTRQDLTAHLETQANLPPETIENAWRELYIAQGSDWFWWYGEPNHSGQDDLFDEQFRLHLGNVYRILKLPVPANLSEPLCKTLGIPSIKPKGPMPYLDTTHCVPNSELLSDTNSDFWSNAGHYDLTHGAMYKATRIIRRVLYGSNDQHVFLKFDLNTTALHDDHQIALYICTPGKTRHNSPMRYRLLDAPGGSSILETQTYLYAYECVIDELSKDTPRLRWSEALPYFLWHRRPDINISYCRSENSLALFIPFNEIGVDDREHIDFSFALGYEGDIDEFHPNTQLLRLERYHGELITNQSNSTHVSTHATAF
jgi:alpha-amylase/alpha-mannosidase (GH57 family)